MNLQGLIDMNYFWWVFNKILAVGIIFLVIFVAISAVGWLLSTLVVAFRKMRS
ncbi:MAG: PTS ascorbate transporter subunit IIC [Clostridia bacterium]